MTKAGDGIPARYAYFMADWGRGHKALRRLLRARTPGKPCDRHAERGQGRPEGKAGEPRALVADREGLRARRYRGRDPSEIVGRSGNRATVGEYPNRAMPKVVDHDPAAELLDCQFSKEKVRFQRASGSAVIKWSVLVKVVRRGSGDPVAGARVVATSTGPGPSETVEGRTGDSGSCTLVLTEYVATPRSPAGGPTNVTPHRIAAYAPDGSILGEVPKYEATGIGGVATIEVEAPRS